MSSPSFCWNPGLLPKARSKQPNVLRPDVRVGPCRIGPHPCWATRIGAEDRSRGTGDRVSNKRDLQLLPAREILQESLAANEVHKKKSIPHVLQTPDLDGELAHLFAQEATPQMKGCIGKYPPPSHTHTEFSPGGDLSKKTDNDSVFMMNWHACQTDFGTS